MTAYASLAEEFARIDQRDHTLLSLRGRDREFYSAPLKIHDAVTPLALGKNNLTLVIGLDRSRDPGSLQIFLDFKRRLFRGFCFDHDSILHFFFAVLNDIHQ